MNLRLQFARNTINWSNEWREIAYTDEKVFQSFANGKILVKRKRRESDNPKYQSFVLQQTRYSINAWCCIVYGRKVIIKLAGPNLNSTKYCNLLEKLNEDEFNNQFHQRYVLQQDNASFHVSAHTKLFFKRKEIYVLNWPPCSPDMNPVEHIWSILQKKLSNHLITHQIRNQDQLFETIVFLADQIPIRDVNKLINSMNRRIKSLLKNNGMSTPY